MIKCALIGYGYWGPNLARNIAGSNKLSLEYICDYNSKSLDKAAALYPHIKLTDEPNAVFDDTNLDAVFIATPVDTHYDLAKSALSSELHVWVEKPLTSDYKQANELVLLARTTTKLLHVDHTFCYMGAVKKLREVVNSTEFGKPFYYDSKRVNLGLFQRDVSVLWDLAVHDLSIVDFLFGYTPQWVNCVGLQHIQEQPVDTGYLTVGYTNGFVANINVSWLSPVKVRQTMLAGSEKMVVFNDLDAEEKIKVYDRGVTIKQDDMTSGSGPLAYRRTGDIWCPHYEMTEALAVEMNVFADAILTNTNTPTSGELGEKCVAILEAAHESISNDGRRVSIHMEEY